VPDGPGVRVEQDGPVTVVTIDRPERRNAVDGPAAAALAAWVPVTRRLPAATEPPPSRSNVCVIRLRCGSNFAG